MRSRNLFVFNPLIYNLYQISYDGFDPPTPPTSDYMMTEGADFMITESGDRMLTE